MKIGGLAPLSLYMLTRHRPSPPKRFDSAPFVALEARPPSAAASLHSIAGLLVDHTAAAAHTDRRQHMEP